MHATDLKSNRPPLLELRQVSHSYVLSSGQKVRALRRIDLTLDSGEALVILGPSGAGKSTCLRIAAGLLRPDKGTVLSNGKLVLGPNTNAAMVFQHFALLPWLNVFQNIAVGLSALKLAEDEIQTRVNHVIQLLGLSGFERAYPRELSGGMKQRTGVARALVMTRPILCLDEPFTAIDVLMAEGLRKEVLNLWRSRQGSIESLLMITHDIHETVLMGSRIIIMRSNPGEIGLTIKNELSYPRDERSAAFRHLVDDIHDVISKTIIPEPGEWVPPVFKRLQMASLPPVFPSEVLSLLEVIGACEGRVDALELSQLLGEDSIQILLMAKTAEILDLVDTQKSTIVLTELGRGWVNAGVARRKQIIHEQLRGLQLVQVLKRYIKLKPTHSLPLNDAIEIVRDVLPNENAEQVLQTLIQWARYGEIFDYNDEDKVINLPRRNSGLSTASR